MHGHIAVVGSLNRDTVVQVDRLPVPGETVIGSAVSQHRGGKGANQAIAAARLGRDVALIGKVGADSDGTGYLRALVQEGVDVEGVQVDIDTPTGQAFIMVDRDAMEASLEALEGVLRRRWGAPVTGDSLRGVMGNAQVLRRRLDAGVLALLPDGGRVDEQGRPVR